MNLNGACGRTFDERDDEGCSFNPHHRENFQLF